MNKQSQNLFELKTRANSAGHQERCWHQPLDGEHSLPAVQSSETFPTWCGQKCQTPVKSWTTAKMARNLWNLKHPVQTRNHAAISQAGRKEVVKGEVFPQHKMEKQPGSKTRGDQTLLRDRTERKNKDSPKPSAGLSFPQWFSGEIKPTALPEICHWRLHKKDEELSKVDYIQMQ